MKQGFITEAGGAHQTSTTSTTSLAALAAMTEHLRRAMLITMMSLWHE
jgi:hypothetical protein